MVFGSVELNFGFNAFAVNHEDLVRQIQVRSTADHLVEAVRFNRAKDFPN